MGFIRKFIKKVAWKYGILILPYRKVCQPSPFEWAEFLRRKGKFYSIGDGCYISPNARIRDPEYTRLGNNVWITDCSTLGHDGSIAMLNVAYGLSLDSVGKVDIKDNVFIGHDAIVLQDTTIGPNAIVAAGAVVTKDVPENSVVAGVPAKVICSLDDHVKNLKVRTEEYPWFDLIRQRGSSGFDPDLEPELKRRRIQHFFGDK